MAASVLVSRRGYFMLISTALTLHLSLAFLAGKGEVPPKTSALLQVQQVALDLQIVVDFEHDALHGVARLTLRNSGTRAVQQVPLLLNRLMTVNSVRNATGRRMAYAEHVALFADDHKLQVDHIVVDLGRSLAPGAQREVVIDYGGSLVGYVETGMEYLRDRIDTAFTILRADAYAFPVVGQPSWAAARAAPRLPFTFRARVTVPEGLIVAAGGQRLAEHRHNGQVTWEYGSSRPVPFLNIAIAHYVVIAERGIQAYVFPDDTVAARRVVAKASDALDTLASWFGALDSVPQVTLIEIPMDWGSQASLTAGIIQDAAAFRDASRLHELYHELTHFWNPPDTTAFSPRLTEGLASLLERRLAHVLDGWHGLDSLAESRATRLRARAVSDSELRTVPMRSYGLRHRTDLSYSAGMLFFYTLQQCIGATAFDALWRDYVAKARRIGGSDQDFVAYALTRQWHGNVAGLLRTWFTTTRWIDRLQQGETLTGLADECRRGS